MSRGLEQEFFSAFFENLKPGGILGVVEHRAPDTAARQEMIDTGYVSEAYVKQIAESAGFEFVASSEINANQKRIPKTIPKGSGLFHQTFEQAKSIKTNTLQSANPTE